jgi:ABC-type spermidine/putrescine transport system permease subunit I
MRFLLPHQFKKIGAFVAPLGFLLWVAAQRGMVTEVLSRLFSENTVLLSSTQYHHVNVAVIITSFFSFLGGIYLVTFSKEKVEDELAQRTRLDSFQFAALVQILVILAGFLLMLFTKEPDREGMMLFFVSVVVLFWLSFIGRFNYVLHFAIKE